MSVQEQLIEVLLAWDRFERENHSQAIIDFNLLGQSAGSARHYDNRLDILQDLEQLAGKSNSDKLQKRLTAHTTFLRALMGQKFDFETYVNRTQGVPKVFYSDEKLHASAEQARKALDELNIKFDKDLFEALRKLERAIPMSDIADHFRATFDQHKPALEKLLERKIDFPLKIEIVDVDAYWSCWVDTQDDVFRLRINSKSGDFTESKALRMVYHELLAHCCQMAIWKEQIANSEMDRIWGLTTVHSPEQFLFEGLAQALPLFLRNEQPTSPILNARMQLSHFESLVDNNLHVMINDGTTVEECLDYAKQHIPWSKCDDILTDLSSRSNHILFRSYQYVYPCSFDFFWDLAEKLSAEQKKRFLSKCYKDILFYDNLKVYQPSS
jgi:hypothetical protein